MNFCAFTGRLGADPEVKTVKADKMVARLRVAVASGSKPKKDGEQNLFQFTYLQTSR